MCVCVCVNTKIYIKKTKRRKHTHGILRGVVCGILRMLMRDGRHRLSCVDRRSGRSGQEYNNINNIV